MMISPLSVFYDALAASYRLCRAVPTACPWIGWKCVLRITSAAPPRRSPCSGHQRFTSMIPPHRMSRVQLQLFRVGSMQKFFSIWRLTSTPFCVVRGTLPLPGFPITLPLARSWSGLGTRLDGLARRLVRRLPVVVRRLAVRGERSALALGLHLVHLLMLPSCRPVRLGSPRRHPSAGQP